MSSIPINIGQTFHTYLENAIAHKVREDEIVEDFVNQVTRNTSLRSIQISPQVTLSVKAKFVHQNPLVKFHNPNVICQKTQVELGDLLFVVKRKRNGQLFDHRSCFSQAKLSSRQGWMIAPHQFVFMSGFRDVQFHFGKTVRALSGGHYDLWRLRTRSNWFQSFLLLQDSNRSSICCTPETMSKLYAQDCKPFHVNSFNSKTRGGIFSFDEFIRYFLNGSGRIGANLKAGTEELSLIDIFYKLAGWTIDPQDEFESYQYGEGGFGIVEFSVVQEQVRE